LQRQKMHRRGEDLPERQPPGGQSRLHGRCPDLASEFQRPVRPYEVSHRCIRASQSLPDHPSKPPP
jgi:hypothetical protein